MITALMKTYKIPFAVIALLGSLAGVVISALDLEKAVKEKRKKS